MRNFIVAVVIALAVFFYNQFGESLFKSEEQQRLEMVTGCVEESVKQSDEDVPEEALQAFCECAYDSLKESGHLKSGDIARLSLGMSLMPKAKALVAKCAKDVGNEYDIMILTY
ncbi:MAG: hypothetical protein HY804_13915 [Nitrospinae bacterium]|nr:hypothetical protein [Nitrospinota bacterium]